jgi:multisubunit Na+/H+ antiporter MnhB subunit
MGPYRDAFMLFGRILSRVIATGLGGVGIYCLVCSSLHPHPDAALIAIITLSGATLLARQGEAK